MAEVHEAVLSDPSGEKYVLEDPEPLRSARLFKFISDALWEQHPSGLMTANFSIKEAMPAGQALEEANEVARHVDEQLVLADGTKNLSIGGMRMEKVTVPRNELAVPIAAAIETFNWDARNNSRLIKVNDRNIVATFVDGHLDYARELSTNFYFKLKGASLAVSYTMQRWQHYQDSPIDLHAGVWYSQFAETGYEGNILHSAELTEEQETEMLTVMAKIGGVSLDNFAE